MLETKDFYIDRGLFNLVNSLGPPQWCRVTSNQGEFNSNKIYIKYN